MSKSLILCASTLLAALSLSTPAAAHPHGANCDEPSARALGPEETARLRARVEHRIERATRHLEALSSEGALSPQQLERARALRERVLQQTRQIFSDGRVTVEEHRALRSLKREARAFRRELRDQLRGRRHRRAV